MKRTVRQLKRSESIARTLVDRITSSNLKDGDSLESEIVMMEDGLKAKGLEDKVQALDVMELIEKSARK